MVSVGIGFWFLHPIGTFPIVFESPSVFQSCSAHTDSLCDVTKIIDFYMQSLYVSPVPRPAQ